MADEVIVPVETPAAVPAAPIAAPVETPVAAPVSTPETSVAPAEPATPAEAPKSTEAPKPDAVSNVMGDAPKPDATKAETPVETPKTEAPKVEAPVYEDFNLPETMTANKEMLGEFTNILGEIETGKLDHAAMQAKGQQLVDLAVKTVNGAIERLNESYVQYHEQQKTGWFDDFKKDAEIGGANIEKTFANIGDAIETYGGNPDQIKALREEMKISGYGNFPPLLRLINNMQQKINSYTQESRDAMVPGQKPMPVKLKPYQQFYSKA